jgi:hypothetical protein
VRSPTRNWRAARACRSSYRSTFMETQADFNYRRNPRPAPGIQIFACNPMSGDSTSYHGARRAHNGVSSIFRPSCTGLGVSMFR